MTCELNAVNEKRGELLAIIDGILELSFAKDKDVVVFDADKLAKERMIIEAPKLVDSRQLQSRVWQFRRASYS